MYPALAVAQALLADGHGDEVWYMGRGNSIEQTLAERAGLPFAAVPAAPVRGTGPVRLALNVANLVRGTWRAASILRRLRPDAIFATGGYVSVPVVVAGWLRRIPSLIYLPDMEPGLAVKALARIATRVAVTAEEAARHFRAGKVIATGYPVREEFAALNRDTARQRLALTDGKVVLVFGGSRGASALNKAVEAALEDILGMAELVHVCGEGDYEALSARRASLPADKQARYHLFAYLHDLPAAMVAADLVISRAGASVLGEFTAAGVPSILVPYPYAGQHQMTNARYLADHGAAIVIENERLGADLLPTVRELLADDTRREAMRESARRLARPNAAQALAQVLRSLAAEGV
ncbi:MAG: undecaprenyldiphospho-muramoylpentapeptide beta-N-acetylglucosaminyltransferase [Anaerolineae bacterium]|nr:undecaprenyldiphospho-muramoylpentapeptide beta-N-acetylglucosaminyltransferase [Anaerolineae bacterium]